MSQTIEVIAPGSTVLVGGDIEAVVLALSLGRDGLQYKVAWWDGRTRTEQWVDQLEVCSRESAAGRNGTIRIGYQ